MNTIIESKLRILLTVLIISAASSANATCNIDILKTTPLSRFTDNNDGTVTDKWTNLVWKQCVEGKFSDGANGCSTNVALMLNWQDSLKRAVTVNAGTVNLNMGYTTWRLPNVKELESIVERHCKQPSINLKLFPDTASVSFWTSTIYSGLGSAWHISFYSGAVVTNGITQRANVRLVRDK